MRIIAGNLGGRIFRAPSGHRTHPMSEKVRGAIFNALGDLSNLTVLDAFGGSGAIGFEAISRGAKSVVIVESSRTAQVSLRRNKKSLEIGQELTLINSPVGSWLKTTLEARFNIVIADPPYDDRQLSNLQSLVGSVQANGIFVLSWPGAQSPPDFSPYQIVHQKDYGDAQLVFYKNVG